MTDQQRHELEAAILAAMVLAYQGAQRHAAQLLTISQPVIGQEARDGLDAFARERADKIQQGINQHLADALAALPEDASDDDQRGAIDTERADIDDYNHNKLIPFLLSTAWHRGLLDTYAATPAKQGTGNARDTTLWEWTQLTMFQDECQRANDASPASYAELMAISGGPPPRHPRCKCWLAPFGV